jgi:retron-type reverse transcriptase
LKRFGNLYNKIISIDNLRLADKTAMKGKLMQYGVKHHLKNQERNIQALHELLKQRKYKTSAYKTFKIYDPKERDIFSLPYYPDRILHHAIMNVLEPVFVSTFVADTYSCIKGRGIHDAQRKLKQALKDKKGTAYCLKLDITKFYPSIDHSILKQLIRRKIKDIYLLRLLDEIIDSAQGIPIGNYLSQYFANFFLCYFDHWIKQIKLVKYYFRYADDLVILAPDKQLLHDLFGDIKQYLFINLNLNVKDNYQIFPVAARGIDFIGYKFYHTHTLLRKSIKKNFARMLRFNPNAASIASYNGWAKHCNSIHLLKKLLPQN